MSHIPQPGIVAVAWEMIRQVKAQADRLEAIAERMERAQGGDDTPAPEFEADSIHYR